MSQQGSDFGHSNYWILFSFFLFCWHCTITFYFLFYYDYCPDLSSVTNEQVGTGTMGNVVLVMWVNSCCERDNQAVVSSQILFLCSCCMMSDSSRCERTKTFALNFEVQPQPVSLLCCLFFFFFFTRWCIHSRELIMSWNQGDTLKWPKRRLELKLFS